MNSGLSVVVFNHGGGSSQHGPNMRWYYLARALKSRDVRVKIIASSYFHKWFSFPVVRGLFGKGDVNGVDYVWLRSNKYKSRILQIVNQLIYSVSSFFLSSLVVKDAVDVVVASSPHPFMVFAAKRLAKKKKAAFVYEVRDLWPLVIQELSGASSNHPYIRLVAAAEKYAIKHCDVVVSVKPGDGEYFYEKYGFDKSRFHCMPNGFLPEEISSADMVSSDSSIFTVGYVGALSAYYQLDSLVESARILKENKDIHFRIVGGGEDEARLKMLVDSYDLDNVTFVGKVHKDRVVKELQGFNACYVGLKKVEANLYGISCNKIFEYMYAAKPIIASYVTNYDPVAMAECGVTISSGSAEDISQAILKLKTDPAMAARLGKNGFRYFSEHHDFSKIAERYSAIFHDLNFGDKDD